MPPKKELDYDLIEDKAARLWKQEDIAYSIGCTPEWFSKKKGEDPRLLEAIERGRAKAKGAIANAQYETGVIDRSIPMLIHLGKHYLKQQEEVKHIGDESHPLKVKLELSIDDILKEYYAAESQSDESKDS